MRKRMIPLLATAMAALALMVAGPASAKTPNDARATKNIVQVASGAPQFSTLVSLIKQAGLVETLSGKGPFTVMAPTNAAFRQVDKATLDRIAADKDLLTKVLTYHVVPAEVKAADVVKLNNKRVGTVAAMTGMLTGLAFTATYILGNLYFGMPRWCLGIGPQGIGAVGMAINFGVTLLLAPFCAPPSEKVQRIVEAIREPEGAGPGVDIEAAPEH